MSRKKYFYDPLLEKGILNTSYSLGRDSSMDNEDYQDVCFCPSNNKLYALRTNSSTSVSKVDVICPNSTTKTCDSSCVGGPGQLLQSKTGEVQLSIAQAWIGFLQYLRNLRLAQLLCKN